MGQQAFGFRKSFHGFGEMEESLAGDGLHADAFYKVSGGKSAAPARPAAGRKDVIASRSVIPERLRSPGSEKHSSGGVNLLNNGLGIFGRSEEHTSELQSRLHLVCRLLLEKKKL